MNVVFFKNVMSEDRPSMKVYVDELLGYMPNNVEGFSIKARTLPFVKHYFHKEFIYPRIAGKYQRDIK